MSLRFFSDQCVPTEITETLKRHAYEVTVLRDVLPIRSLDPVVIAKAQALGAVHCGAASNLHSPVTATS